MPPRSPARVVPDRSGRYGVRTSSAIVGPTTIAQLDADLGALGTHLDPATLQALDEIWPALGEAPQAYAW